MFLSVLSDCTWILCHTLGDWNCSVDERCASGQISIALSNYGVPGENPRVAWLRAHRLNTWCRLVGDRTSLFAADSNLSFSSPYSSTKSDQAFLLFHFLLIVKFIYPHWGPLLMKMAEIGPRCLAYFKLSTCYHKFHVSISYKISPVINNNKVVDRDEFS